MMKGHEFPPVPSEINRITDINNFDVAKLTHRCPRPTIQK